MKSFFFICCLFLCINFYAQSVILLEQDSVSEIHEDVDISNNFIDFPIDLYFKNNTNESISINWRREFGPTCPLEWDISTADQFYTYVPDIEESQVPIQMTPTDSHFIVRHVIWPRTVAGCCDIKVIFSLEGDPNNPIDTGYYHMEINSNECFVTSISKTEIEQIKIYPNPTSGLLFIENDYLVEDFEVLDMIGKVYQKNYDLRNNEIDISSLPAGIYYLKIKSKKGEEWIEKIVKR